MFLFVVVTDYTEFTAQNKQSAKSKGYIQNREQENEARLYTGHLGRMSQLNTHKWVQLVRLYFWCVCDHAVYIESKQEMSVIHRREASESMEEK